MIQMNTKQKTAAHASDRQGPCGQVRDNCLSLAWCGSVDSSNSIIVQDHAQADAPPPGNLCRDASTQEGRTIMSPRELTSTRCPGRLYRNTIFPPRVTTSCIVVITNACAVQYMSFHPFETCKHPFHAMHMPACIHVHHLPDMCQSLCFSLQIHASQNMLAYAGLCTWS